MVVQKGAGAALPKSSAGQNPNYEQISQDPMKHVITFIEKKIRNLDKRKAKLDGYRKMVENGQPLDPDQTAAASKYDEVIGSLEFAKDLIKSFEITMTEVMKQQRKSTRRELMAREESDNNRVCFIIRATRMMELLHENELIKEDFLNGTNGACVVSKLELDQLVNFYELFIMKSYDPGANVTEDGNSAGNHLYELAEARSKDIVGTTYKELRTVLDRINDCKYFEDLPDTTKVAEIHQTQKDDVESVSTESSTKEVDDKLEEKDKEPEELGDENAVDAHVLSPNSSEALSSQSGFSADAPLKTEEFLPSAQTMYPTTQTDSNWQQQSLQPKPEAGDFITQSMSFQYVPGSNVVMQQQPAYPVQTIQDVLKEVQGPCQFLQDSVLDFEVPGALSFTGMEMLPTQTTLPPPSRTHQIDPGLTSATHLQAGFSHPRNASPADQTTPMPSQGLTGAQQHLAPTRDSPSHLPNTVNHPEHVPSTLSQVQNSLHLASQQGNMSMNQDSYCTTRGQTSYIDTVVNPARDSPQSSMEYNMQHQPQGQVPHQQQDNLGLGQTTFGGQQQAAGGGHSVYGPEGGSYPQQTDSYKPNVSYNSGTANSYDTTSSAKGIPNIMQLSSASLQAPDPPTTHIPLPNEQQSGYRSYQSNEISQTETQGVNATEINLQDQTENALKNSTQDQKMSEMRQRDVQEAKISSAAGDPVAMGEKHHDNTQMEQNSGYGSRGTAGPRQVGGTSSRPGRGGYSNGGGFRSGPINQGGGYHQPRNTGYRGGTRYSGNYDSMGRPTSNYSGGYQNNQPGYMYRTQQDPYGYGRRGAGGNMRAGRAGHQPRGNQRGGGNYNRSRTFRPQHSNEQAA